MKTLQTHSINGALIQITELDGVFGLYAREQSGRDAAVPISAEILRSMLDAVEPARVSTYTALARDWSPEACTLIERVRSVMHAIAEHRNAAERTALWDVVAAHMRSVAPLAGRAA